MTDFAALTLTLDSTGIKGGISELNRLGDAGDKAERNISRSTGIIKDSFDSIKNAAIGVVSAYGALSTIKGLANAAIDVEKFESALKVATGSAKAANAELDFIRKTSNELGLSLRDTTDQYSKLAVAAKGTKLEGQAVREIFVGISQAATALKLRSDETSGALLAIQQIISKGTVSAEELRGQLGERLPGAFQIAARSIGVTTEELGKLLQKGELTAEVLLPNFARELQKTFGAESQAAAAGLQSQINRFNNALFELQVAIGRVGIIDFFTSATQSVSVFLSKSADIVKLYGNDVRIAFAAVIDVGRGVINTFQGAALGIASVVAQVKALLQLDIKKAISIDPVAAFKKPFSDSFTKTIDETILSIANKPIELNVTANKNEIAKIPSLIKSQSTGSSKAKEISESERFIQSLKKEAEEANKTEIELLQLRASKLGVSDAAAPLIAKIEQSTIAFNKEKDAAQQLANNMLEVERVTESVLTPTEKLARETERLNKLLNLPNNAGISMETYNRAIKRANDEFVKLSTQGKKSFDDVTQFAIQAERNIQTSLGDALRQGFEGNLSGMVSSFKSALAQMVSQAISADLLGNLFGKSAGFGNISALLDTFKRMASGSVSFGGGQDSLLSGVTGLGNIFKDGFSSIGKTFSNGFSRFTSLFSGAPRGAFTGASFLGLGQSGSALANGVGAGASSGGLLSGLGGTLAGAGIGIGIGTLLGGDKKVGGIGAGLLSTGGAALGAIGGPIGAAVGGILGGAISALFGRGPLKQKETNLIGSFNSEGFSGITSTKLKAEGGLLVGDKVIRIQADADTGKLLGEFNGKLKDTASKASEAAVAVGKFLDDGIKAITKEVETSAKSMGISADLIKGFTQSINIASEKGKGLTEEQLTKAITGFGDAMARQLIPEIDNLKKSGESAASAFVRLGSEFETLVDVMEVLGSSTQNATEFLKGVSFESRAAFLNMAGGADKLNSQLSLFADNFLTVEERIKPAQELLNKTFKDLGISGINTKEQFSALVKAQDLTTESGQKMFVALLDIQDEFLAVNEAFGGLGTTIETVTEQIKKATDDQIKIAERRAELAARERKEAAKNEELKKAQEAQEKVTQSAIDMRESLLRAGDAMALLANEFIIKKPSINKDANFSTEIAKANAKLATDLIGELSSIALEVKDVKSVIASLTRTATSQNVVKPIADSIRSAITGGQQSDAINRSISRLVNVLAVNQARSGIDRLGQGIADVLAAQRKLSNASATESVNGRLQFGKDIIEYAKAIDSLNDQYKKGTISADQHEQALSGLTKAMGGNAKLLNDTAAQMERIKKASLELGKAGLDSIGFYFNQITKSAKELDKEASELQTPLGKVSDAIGRLKSAAFVFAESASAVKDGFKDIKPDVLRDLSKAGGQLSKANIVANAAGIASQVLTTIGGKQAQQKIESDPLFKNKNARDLGLLLEGITAFDPESFERAFTRLNAALAKGAVNEAQYAKLFNIALDSFEGLDSGINNTTASLGDLRKAAKNAADSLLLDKKLSTLSPKQQFNFAEKQFTELISKARGGDTSAASELDGAARTLLEAGQAALSNQTDLFTFVQAQLRSVEQSGSNPRLEVDKSILKQLENMNKKLEEQQTINQQLTAQVASINMRSADTLERWEKIGMPATRA